MSDKPSECRTVLLDDAPATEDAFGPHKRVADAIASLVTSEPGGRAIGVEGGWGAGKSTVISFVRKALGAHQQYRVITFDAWAHEGDPLRRTYLETIIGELTAAGWVDSTEWNKTLEELANRRRSTTTRITPKPTWLGVLFAISLVLVPIGTTLLTIAFRNAGPATFVDLRSWHWIARAGAFFALAPIVVLIGNLLRVVTRIVWRFLWSKTPWPVVRPKPDSDWSFLLSKAIEETRTDTTETPNPTSIEFEKDFTRAMKEALGSDPNRRLLLVLDNLDRVDPESAIGIWSTLQTFLQERNSLNSDWFKQLWVVVPYDPVGLRKLWDNWSPSNGTVLDNTEPADSPQVASDSFIDKSFQIRFQVPLPVLSDWKSYLDGLVARALPDHDEADRHMLYRVYQEWRTRHFLPPTPRELKLYVNQVGAIHRQWQHDFPIGHVAYYVLLCREHGSVIEKLRSAEFPHASIKRLLPNNLIPSLAGLAFNVSASKGMELLLTDQIVNCLTKETARELEAMVENYGPGFWAVAESIMSARLRDASPSDIAHAVRVLYESQLLRDNDSFQRRSVRAALQEAVFAVTDWQPLGAEIANGIAAAHRLFSDSELSTHLNRRLSATVSQWKPGEKKQDISDALVGLVRVFNTTTEIGFSEAIPETTVIPSDVEGWITLCETLAGDESSARFWKHFRPKEKPEAITTALQAAVDAGEFNDRHAAAIRVTASCLPKTDWSNVASSMQARLDAGIGATTDEARRILRGLWNLEQLGSAKATKALKTLVTGGHIAHHLNGAGKHKEGAALCQFTILRQDPKASDPPAVGNSSSGHQLLTNALASTDTDNAEAFCDSIRLYGKLTDLFDVIDARGSSDPMLAVCLQLIAESDAPEDLFSSQIVLTRWRQIQDALTVDEDDQRFEVLLSTLADHHGLCAAIQNDASGFSPDEAVLYWTLVKVATSDQSRFWNWCREGLESLDKEAWAKDLRESFECVWLACLLAEKGIKTKLTTRLSDALVEHASSLVLGQQAPESVVAGRWNDLLGLLDHGVRRALPPRILSIAIESDGRLSEPFLTMYGGVIGKREVLASSPQSIVGLFSPIVRERNVPALEWLVAFMRDNDDFLSQAAAGDNIEEFRARLQDCVESPQDDNAQPLIQQLAQLLGIQPIAADDPSPEVVD